MLLVVHILCSDYYQFANYIIVRYFSFEQLYHCIISKEDCVSPYIAMTLTIVGKICFCNCKLMQSNKLLGGEFSILRRSTQSIDSTLLCISAAAAVSCLEHVHSFCLSHILACLLLTMHPPPLHSYSIFVTTIPPGYRQDLE